MASPIITIGIPSKTKISAISGHDQSIVTFQSNVELISWEARATIGNQIPGHGVGLLVETGTALAANTNATVYIENEELTNGDNEYTITIFGHGSDGYWSDGTYEGINIFDPTDSNTVFYDDGVTYSNGTIIFNAGTQNTNPSDAAIKVQEMMNDWSYINQVFYDGLAGVKSANIIKSSSYDTLRISLNGNNADISIYIDADALMENGDTYTLTFNVAQISMNYIVIEDVTIVKVVI